MKNILLISFALVLVGGCDKSSNSVVSSNPVADDEVFTFTITGFFLVLSTTIDSYPSSMVMLKPPSFDFIPISKVSAIDPVLVTIRTKSVS